MFTQESFDKWATLSYEDRKNVPIISIAKSLEEIEQPVSTVSEDVDKVAELITPDMNERQIQRIENAIDKAEWQKQQFMQFENIKCGFLIRNGDEINSILIAALRSLNPDQLIILRDSLIARTPKDTADNEKMYIEIDVECALLEDVLHGQEGKQISHIRKLLSEWQKQESDKIKKAHEYKTF